MSLLKSDVFRQIVSSNHARRDIRLPVIDLKNRVLREKISP